MRPLILLCAAFFSCSSPQPPSRLPGPEAAPPEVAVPGVDTRGGAPSPRSRPRDGGHAPRPLVTAIPTEIALATWNVRRLGESRSSLPRIASVIRRFDMVAIQEVMRPESVEALLAHLPGWRAQISARPVGTGKYREYYALLYRADRVRLSDWFSLADRAGQFERDPFVACFIAGAFDGCVVSIHVIYGPRVGPRDAEIAALADRVQRLRRERPEKDWIVLGDFNRPGTAKGFRTMFAQGFALLLGEGRVKTTLGMKGYSHAYDHILVDRDYTSEVVGPARRFDVIAEICGGDVDECRRTLSDHAPVSARFRTVGPDDD